MAEAYKIAEGNSRSASARGKTQYDQKERGVVLKVGDRVLVRNLGERGSPGKLQSYWEKMIYVVREQVSDNPVVNKAAFIPAFATQSTLSILALTETWIRPEDTATPAALSNNFSFSHTPRHTGRGGGTGQLTSFLEELDVLLSSLPEDGRPLVVLGDFNIHQDKPQAIELNTLLASFDLERLHTTATHRSGNQLDLIFTRNCTTSNILVTPLHVSDHYFVQFNMILPSIVKPTPPLVSFRRNLRSLSPSRLSTDVSASLPTINVFSMLDVNTATDTLSSTLTTCLDNICPL
ncbi:uncharacterized protein LOC127633357, partial [Xyrauchen texanus]|uniref:uncharacterized protein LOC127633357 n=1 Tax=Xyrauchen texanus TaxID=154827 RepID=UPI0022429D05